MHQLDHMILMKDQVLFIFIKPIIQGLIGSESSLGPITVQ